MIYDIVTNPKYVGTNVSNRTSFNLRKKSVKNPPEMWVRRDNAFPAIIGAETFDKAQFITADRAHRYTDAELQAALDALLKRKGRLSLSILRQSPEVPCPDVYQKHYGGLGAAYRAIGTSRKAIFHTWRAYARLHAIRQQLVAQLVKELVTAGATVFEAVRTAMRWFADPHWRGPKPTLETMFEVSLVGDERKWRVSGRATSPPVPDRPSHP